MQLVDEPLTQVLPDCGYAPAHADVLAIGRFAGARERFVKPTRDEVEGLRRVALLGELAPDAVLLGSRHSGATQTIREFLSRNGQPFIYQGERGLERVRWRQVDSGEAEAHDIRNLFLMTGADPNTGWLDGCLLLDEKRFVKTGVDLLPEDLASARWPLPRRPYLMESSIPGVFCVGDARATSVKRVASAVGEGSICIQLVHRALAEL